MLLTIIWVLIFCCYGWYDSGVEVFLVACFFVPTLNVHGSNWGVAACGERAIRAKCWRISVIEFVCERLLYDGFRTVLYGARPLTILNLVSWKILKQITDITVTIRRDHRGTIIPRCCTPPTFVS